MRGRLAVTDSTHVKANASRASEQEAGALEKSGNSWELEYQLNGTFAAQKWGHNLTRLLRRSLEAAEDHCLFVMPKSVFFLA